MPGIDIAGLVDFVPDWLLEALNFGFEYPDGDHRALFALDDVVWGQGADEFRELIPLVEAAMDTTLQAYKAGYGREAAKKEFHKFIYGDKDDDRPALTDIAKGMDELAAFSGSNGDDVQHTKIMMGVFAGITAYAVFALMKSVYTTPFIPLVVAAGRQAIMILGRAGATKAGLAAAIQAVKPALMTAVKEIGVKPLLVQAGKSGLKAGALGFSLDAGIQAYQFTQHRDEMDWGQALRTAAGWAGGGILAAPVAMALARGLGREFMVQGVRRSIMADFVRPVAVGVGSGTAGAVGMYGGDLAYQYAANGFDASKVDTTFHPQMLAAGVGLGGMHGARQGVHAVVDGHSPRPGSSSERMAEGRRIVQEAYRAPDMKQVRPISPDQLAARSDAAQMAQLRAVLGGDGGGVPRHVAEAARPEAGVTPPSRGGGAGPVTPTGDGGTTSGGGSGPRGGGTGARPAEAGGPRTAAGTATEAAPRAGVNESGSAADTGAKPAAEQRDQAANPHADAAPPKLGRVVEAPPDPAPERGHVRQVDPESGSGGSAGAGRPEPAAAGETGTGVKVPQPKFSTGSGEGQGPGSVQDPIVPPEPEPILNSPESTSVATDPVLPGVVELRSFYPTQSSTTPIAPDMDSDPALLPVPATEPGGGDRRPGAPDGVGRDGDQDGEQGEEHDPNALPEIVEPRRNESDPTRKPYIYIPGRSEPGEDDPPVWTLPPPAYYPDPVRHSVDPLISATYPSPQDRSLDYELPDPGYMTNPHDPGPPEPDIPPDAIPALHRTPAMNPHGPPNTPIVPPHPPLPGEPGSDEPRQGQPAEFGPTPNFTALPPPHLPETPAGRPTESGASKRYATPPNPKDPGAPTGLDGGLSDPNAPEGPPVGPMRPVEPRRAKLSDFDLKKAWERSGGKPTPDTNFGEFPEPGPTPASIKRGKDLYRKLIKDTHPDRQVEGVDPQEQEQFAEEINVARTEADAERQHRFARRDVRKLEEIQSRWHRLKRGVPEPRIGFHPRIPDQTPRAAAKSQHDDGRDGTAVRPPLPAIGPGTAPLAITPGSSNDPREAGTAAVSPRPGGGPAAPGQAIAAGPAPQEDGSSWLSGNTPPGGDDGEAGDGTMHYTPGEWPKFRDGMAGQVIELMHWFGMPPGDIPDHAQLLLKTVVDDLIARTASPFRLSASITGDIGGRVLRIEVTDTRPDLPVREAENGYEGLASSVVTQLDSLAHLWDVNRSTEGNQVWFEFFERPSVGSAAPVVRDQRTFGTDPDSPDRGLENEAIRLLVRTVLREAGWSRDRAYDAELAASELAGNVLKYTKGAGLLEITQAGEPGHRELLLRFYDTNPQLPRRKEPGETTVEQELLGDLGDIALGENVDLDLDLLANLAEGGRGIDILRASGRLGAHPLKAGERQVEGSDQDYRKVVWYSMFEAADFLSAGEPRLSGGTPPPPGPPSQGPTPPRLLGDEGTFFAADRELGASAQAFPVVPPDPARLADVFYVIGGRPRFDDPVAGPGLGGHGRGQHAQGAMQPFGSGRRGWDGRPIRRRSEQPEAEVAESGVAEPVYADQTVDLADRPRLREERMIGHRPPEVDPALAELARQRREVNWDELLREQDVLLLGDTHDNPEIARFLINQATALYAAGVRVWVFEAPHHRAFDELNSGTENLDQVYCGPSTLSREILRAMATVGMEVVAVDVDHAARPTDEEREAHMAAKIAEAQRRHPEEKVAVHVGNGHIGWGRWPSGVLPVGQRVRDSAATVTVSFTGGTDADSALGAAAAVADAAEVTFVADLTDYRRDGGEYGSEKTDAVIHLPHRVVADGAAGALDEFRARQDRLARQARLPGAGMGLQFFDGLPRGSVAGALDGRAADLRFDWNALSQGVNQLGYSDPSASDGVAAPQTPDNRRDEASAREQYQCAPKLVNGIRANSGRDDIAEMGPAGIAGTRISEVEAALAGIHVSPAVAPRAQRLPRVGEAIRRLTRRGVVGSSVLVFKRSVPGTGSRGNLWHVDQIVLAEHRADGTFRFEKHDPSRGEIIENYLPTRVEAHQPVLGLFLNNENYPVPIPGEDGLFAFRWDEEDIAVGHRPPEPDPGPPELFGVAQADVREQLRALERRRDELAAALGIRDPGRLAVDQPGWLVDAEIATARIQVADDRRRLIFDLAAETGVAQEEVDLERIGLPRELAAYWALDDRRTDILNREQHLPELVELLRRYRVLTAELHYDQTVAAVRAGDEIQAQVCGPIVERIIADEALTGSPGGENRDNQVAWFPAERRLIVVAFDGGHDRALTRLAVQHRDEFDGVLGSAPGRDGQDYSIEYRTVPRPEAQPAIAPPTVVPAARLIDPAEVVAAVARVRELEQQRDELAERLEITDPTTLAPADPQFKELFAEVRRDWRELADELRTDPAQLWAARLDAFGDPAALAQDDPLRPHAECFAAARVRRAELVRRDRDIDQLATVVGERDNAMRELDARVAERFIAERLAHGRQVGSPHAVVIDTPGPDLPVLCVVALEGRHRRALTDLAFSDPAEFTDVYLPPTPLRPQKYTILQIELALGADGTVAEATHAVVEPVGGYHHALSSVEVKALLLELYLRHRRGKRMLEPEGFPNWLARAGVGPNPTVEDLVRVVRAVHPDEVLDIFGAKEAARQIVEREFTLQDLSYDVDPEGDEGHLVLPRLIDIDGFTVRLQIVAVGMVRSGEGHYAIAKTKGAALSSGEVVSAWFGGLAADSPQALADEVIALLRDGARDLPFGDEAATPPVELDLVEDEADRQLQRELDRAAAQLPSWQTWRADPATPPGELRASVRRQVEVADRQVRDFHGDIARWCGQLGLDVTGMDPDEIRQAVRTAAERQQTTEPEAAESRTTESEATGAARETLVARLLCDELWQVGAALEAELAAVLEVAGIVAARDEIAAEQAVPLCEAIGFNAVRNEIIVISPVDDVPAVLRLLKVTQEALLDRGITIRYKRTQVTRDGVLDVTEPIFGPEQHAGQDDTMIEFYRDPVRDRRLRRMVDGRTLAQRITDTRSLGGVDGKVSESYRSTHVTCDDGTRAIRHWFADSHRVDAAQAAALIAEAMLPESAGVGPKAFYRDSPNSYGAPPGGLPTMADVARLAGANPTTVARVFDGDGDGTVDPAQTVPSDQQSGEQKPPAAEPSAARVDQAGGHAQERLASPQEGPATPHRAVQFGSSLFVGTIHRTDPDHPQSIALTHLLHDWIGETNGQERIFLTEGRVRVPGATERESLSGGSEMTLIAYLAGEHGIEIRSMEENLTEQVAALIQDGNNRDAVFLYYVLRHIPQGLRAQEGFRPDIDEHLREAIDLYSFILSGNYDPHGEFLRLVEHEYPEQSFPRQFRPEDEGWLLRETVDTMLGAPVISRVQHVAATCHHRRETIAAETIQEHMAAGSAVFAAFGEPHFDVMLRMMPNFLDNEVFALGPPNTNNSEELDADPTLDQPIGFGASDMARSGNRVLPLRPDSADLVSGLGIPWRWVRDLAGAPIVARPLDPWTFFAHTPGGDGSADAVRPLGEPRARSESESAAVEGGSRSPDAEVFAVVGSADSLRAGLNRTDLVLLGFDGPVANLSEAAQAIGAKLMAMVPGLPDEAAALASAAVVGVLGDRDTAAIAGEVTVERLPDGSVRVTASDDRRGVGFVDDPSALSGARTVSVIVTPEKRMRAVVVGESPRDRKLAFDHAPDGTRGPKGYWVLLPDGGTGYFVAAGGESIRVAYVEGSGGLHATAELVVRQATAGDVRAIVKAHRSGVAAQLGHLLKENLNEFLEGLKIRSARYWTSLVGNPGLQVVECGGHVVAFFYVEPKDDGSVYWAAFYGLLPGMGLGPEVWHRIEEEHGDKIISLVVVDTSPVQGWHEANGFLREGEEDTPPPLKDCGVTAKLIVMKRPPQREPGPRPRLRGAGGGRGPTAADQDPPSAEVAKPIDDQNPVGLPQRDRVEPFPDPRQGLGTWAFGADIAATLNDPASIAGVRDMMGGKQLPDVGPIAWPAGRDLGWWFAADPEHPLPPHEPAESELWELVVAAQRDPAAFGPLRAHFEEQVRAQVTAAVRRPDLSHSDRLAALQAQVESIVTEVFRRMRGGVGGVRAGQDVGVWVGALVGEVLADRVRFVQHARFRWAIEDAAAEGPERDALHRASGPDFRRAVEGLARGQGRAIRLLFWGEGMSFRAAAEVMGVGPGVVEDVMRAGVRRLATELGAEIDEFDDDADAVDEDALAGLLADGGMGLAAAKGVLGAEVAVLQTAKVERFDELRSFVEQLSEEHRDLFVRWWSGDQVPDIARAVGRRGRNDKAAVYNRLYRVIGGLAEQLSPAEQPEAEPRPDIGPIPAAGDALAELLAGGGVALALAEGVLASAVAVLRAAKVERFDDFCRAVERLSDGHRELFVRWFLGQSVLGIAEAVGSSEGSVHVRLYRIIPRIAGWLSGGEGTPEPEPAVLDHTPRELAAHRQPPDTAPVAGDHPELLEQVPTEQLSVAVEPEEQPAEGDPSTDPVAEVDAVPRAEGDEDIPEQWRLERARNWDRVVAVRAGNLAAMDDLFREYESLALGVAMRYLDSEADAQDVVAESFARILGKLRRGEGEGAIEKFRGYLLGVVRNVSLEFRSSAARQIRTDTDGFAEPISGQSGTDSGETAIGRAFESLPPELRTVLRLTTIEDFSVAEAARRLDSTPDAVAVLVERAHDGLRAAFLQERASGWALAAALTARGDALAEALATGGERVAATASIPAVQVAVIQAAKIERLDDLRVAVEHLLATQRECFVRWFLGQSFADIAAAMGGAVPVTERRLVGTVHRLFKQLNDSVPVRYQVPVAARDGEMAAGLVLGNLDAEMAVLQAAALDPAQRPMLWCLVEQLSPEHQECFVRWFVTGQSFGTIAAAMGGTLDGSLSRVRWMVRTLAGWLSGSVPLGVGGERMLVVQVALLDGHRDQVLDLVDRLPERQKDVFLRWFVQRQTITEMAIELGVSENALRVRLRRAVQVVAGGVHLFAPWVMADAGSKSNLVWAALQEDSVLWASCVDEHLSPKLREAIRLQFVEGLSPKEIARRVESTPNTVRIRLYRAIRLLAAWLPAAFGERIERLYEVRRPTTIDVARLAGVDRSMVSRGLDGGIPAHRPTMARIRAAAEELGYTKQQGAVGPVTQNDVARLAGVSSGDVSAVVRDRIPRHRPVAQRVIAAAERLGYPIPAAGDGEARYQRPAGVAPPTRVDPPTFAEELGFSSDVAGALLPRSRGIRPDLFFAHTPGVDGGEPADAFRPPGRQSGADESVGGIDPQQLQAKGYLAGHDDRETTVVDRADDGRDSAAHQAVAAQAFDTRGSRPDPRSDPAGVADVLDVVGGRPEGQQLGRQRFDPGRVEAGEFNDDQSVSARAHRGEVEALRELRELREQYWRTGRSGFSDGLGPDTFYMSDPDRTVAARARLRAVMAEFPADDVSRVGIAGVVDALLENSLGAWVDELDVRRDEEGVFVVSFAVRGSDGQTVLRLEMAGVQASRAAATVYLSPGDAGRVVAALALIPELARGWEGGVQRSRTFEVIVAQIGRLLRDGAGVIEMATSGGVGERLLTIGIATDITDRERGRVVVTFDELEGSLDTAYPDAGDAGSVDLPDIGESRLTVSSSDSDAVGRRRTVRVVDMQGLLNVPPFENCATAVEVGAELTYLLGAWPVGFVTDGVDVDTARARARVIFATELSTRWGEAVDETDDTTAARAEARGDELLDTAASPHGGEHPVTTISDNSDAAPEQSWHESAAQDNSDAIARYIADAFGHDGHGEAAGGTGRSEGSARHREAENVGAAADATHLVSVDEFAARLAAAVRSERPERMTLPHMITAGSMTELLFYPEASLWVVVKSGLTRKAAAAEICASAVGHAIKAPVPPVIGVGDHTVVMPWMPGEDFKRIDADLEALRAAMATVRDTSDAERLGHLDVLINNWDRPRNWLRYIEAVAVPGRSTGQRRAFGYDHAASFQRPVDPNDNVFALRYVSGLNLDNLDADDPYVWVAPNGLKRSEQIEYLENLPALRPLFEAEGFPDWLEGVLIRQRKFIEHAESNE